MLALHEIPEQERIGKRYYVHTWCDTTIASREGNQWCPKRRLWIRMIHDTEMWDIPEGVAFNPVWLAYPDTVLSTSNEEFIEC